MSIFVFSFGFAQEDVLRPHGKKVTATNEDWSYKRNPIIIGVEGGLNINFFSQAMVWDPTFPHGTIWNGLTSASGISPHFGVLVDVPINKTFNVQLRASYDMKNFGTSTSGTDYDFFSQVHDMNLKVDVAAAYITLTPLLRINATDKLFFTVGPTFHFLAGDIETTWSPTSLDGTQLNDFPFWNRIYANGQPWFQNGQVTGSAKENEIDLDQNGNVRLVQKSMRVGVEGGVGYKIPLSKSIFLVPQGRFQLMFTPVTDDTHWRDINNLNSVVETSSKKMLNSLQLALALWFEI
ncbi:MAG: outer membrane beta-barrel protein [Ignavibacteriae bacterium]|nr:outer membrane beta-barrel protein [Ignavibacteriota bacterium]